MGGYDALLRRYMAAWDAKQKHLAQNKLLSMYPETGQYRRELYPKHVSFFTQPTRQRLYIGGNRTGKSTSGAYETALHLTGLYPDWWERLGGWIFKKPVNIWAAGDTNESTRDVIQKELLGEVSGVKNGKRWVSGEGMIPYHLIEGIKWKQGVSDLVDYVVVRHASGGMSRVGLKTYAQGRKAFQGTAKDFVWFDEEPPRDVYSEAMTRTATTDGKIITTFTPLSGASEMVLSFLPDGHVVEYNDGTRTVVNMTWDETPHLTVEAKNELLQGYSPHERDARIRGLPSLGSGAVYPVPESQVFVPDFPIPSFWPRFFAMDVGWNWNAAIWGAIDRDSGTLYFYSECKMSQVEPETFAKAIKSRGDWIHGVVDPASQGANQFDGRALLTEYQGLGLNLTPADNAVEAGIFDVYTMMISGRLKIFESCSETRKEFRLYMRDDKGKIRKVNDHLMDVTRYGCRSGVNVARMDPAVYDRGLLKRPNARYSEFNPYDHI